MIEKIVFIKKFGYLKEEDSGKRGWGRNRGRERGREREKGRGETLYIEKGSRIRATLAFSREHWELKENEKTISKFRGKMISTVELYNLYKLWNTCEGRIKTFQIHKGFTWNHTNHHQRKLITQCCLHTKEKIIIINCFYFMEVAWEKLTSQKKAWWNLKNSNMSKYLKPFEFTFYSTNMYWVSTFCQHCFKHWGYRGDRNRSLCLIEHIREMFR